MLTIDKQLQIEVQNILQQFSEHLREANGKGKDVKGGAIVVTDVKTGEILAAATYPTYTYADLADDTVRQQLENDKVGKPMSNRAFREIYRPGSTFKTITATGALTEGTINGSSTVTCTGKYTYNAQYQPTCTGVHGTISVVEALKMSCNIFFYDVGRRLGIDNIGKYAHLYGFGEDTGLEIPNAKGQVSSPELYQAEGLDWYEGNTWQSAIGQGETKVTPLQLAIQAATVANNGTRYATHIIKSVTNYDMTQTVQETQPQILSQIQTSQETYDLIHEGMREAANRRATMVSIPGGVAIKTGTPQVTNTTTNSTVIGYYPAAVGTTPEIAASAVLEEGEYSADMLAQVIEAYINLKAQRDAAQNNSSSQSSDSSTATSSDTTSTTEHSFNVTGDPNADR